MNSNEKTELPLSALDLDGLENCRPQILAFALLMERELRANEHKGGWENDHPVGLCDHLDEETRELRAVVNARWEIVWRPAADRFDRGNGWSRQNPDTGVREIGCGYKMLEQPWLGANSERIASEAADVANMAMMVADVCDALPSRTALPKALAEIRRQQTEGVTVPAGLRLVPIEPTEAMTKAGYEEVCAFVEDGRLAGPDEVFAAMLSAAPEPPKALAERGELARERIVRAAIRAGEGVYTVPQPGRHGDVFRLIEKDYAGVDAEPEDQGFLTSTGRFVGREQALQIATTAGQIIRQSSGPNPRELFSEDVW